LESKWSVVLEMGGLLGAGQLEEIVQEFELKMNFDTHLQFEVEVAHYLLILSLEVHFGLLEDKSVADLDNH